MNTVLLRMKALVVLLVIVLIVPNVFAQLDHKHNCVIVVNNDTYELLCVARSNSFIGEYDELTSLSKGIFEVTYVGKGKSIEGALIMSLNASMGQGMLIVKIKSMLGSNASSIVEDLSAATSVESKVIRVSFFKYTIEFPASKSHFENVTMDISGNLSRALSRLKYLISIGEAYLSLSSSNDRNSISVVSRDLEIDRILYQDVKGLANVCKNLASSVGSMEFRLGYIKDVTMISLKAQGNVTNLFISLACLTPIALDIASKISYIKSPLSDVISSIYSLSNLLKMSYAIPTIINSFIKPLMLEYRGMEILGLAGMKVHLVGNGTNVALNLTIWPIGVSFNKTVVKEITTLALNLVSQRVPLKEIVKLFDVDNAKVCIPVHSVTTSTIEVRSSWGISALTYVIIALLVAQCAIVIILVFKVFKRR